MSSRSPFILLSASVLYHLNINQKDKLHSTHLCPLAPTLYEICRCCGGFVQDDDESDDESEYSTDLDSDDFDDPSSAAADRLLRSSYRNSLTEVLSHTKYTDYQPHAKARQAKQITTEFRHLVQKVDSSAKTN